MSQRLPFRSGNTLCPNVRSTLAVGTLKNTSPAVVIVVGVISSVPKLTEVKPVQYANAFSLIDVATGKSTEVKPVQPSNAFSSIDVTTGKLTKVKPVQPENALKLIDVVAGKLTEVKPVQFSNVQLPI